MITFEKFRKAKTIYYVYGYVNKQNKNETPEFVCSIYAVPFATQKEAIKFIDERNHNISHLNVGEVEHLNLYKHKMTKDYKEMLSHFAIKNDSQITELSFCDIWDYDKDVFIFGTIKKRNE